jgi:hypothetical protein
MDEIFRRSPVVNKSQKKLLSEVVSAVVRHDKNLWWALKRQIFDFGYQSFYPFQSDFEGAAKGILKNLSSVDRQLLIGEWRNANPTDREMQDSDVLVSYVPLVIEKVVERARSAANRTNDWG